MDFYDQLTDVRAGKSDRHVYRDTRDGKLYHVWGSVSGPYMGPVFSISPLVRPAKPVKIKRGARNPFHLKPSEFKFFEPAYKI